MGAIWDRIKQVAASNNGFIRTYNGPSCQDIFLRIYREFL